MLPVSARAEAALDLLKAELLRAARAAPKKDASRYLRLPIDRSFAMRGFGTVVTGTLVAGSVKVDDEVELYPTGRRLRVRGLHSGGASVECALAGQRTAVNTPASIMPKLRVRSAWRPPGNFQPSRSRGCANHRVTFGEAFEKPRGCAFSSGYGRQLPR